MFVPTGNIRTTPSHSSSEAGSARGRYVLVLFGFVLVFGFINLYRSPLATAPTNIQDTSASRDDAPSMSIPVDASVQLPKSVPDKGISPSQAIPRGPVDFKALHPELNYAPELAPTYTCKEPLLLGRDHQGGW